jgi:hypothetical protein
MACEFSIEHYAELLGAARAGGYRFAFFDREPQPGDLLLRHDVDLSLDAAVTIAELEAGLGVTATYFLMTRSEFYNLASPSGVAAVERLRALGHRVGLHAVHPHVDLDARFDRVVAWHNPDSEYMTSPVEGAVNVMQAGFFDPARYRSDSNQRWRHGCPEDDLAAGAYDWLQLLVHPEIWVYPGDSMGETMLALADSERDRLLRLLAADRIDLT